jgi:hypothetical protein
MAEAIFKADFPDDQDLWDECEGDTAAIYNRMAIAALAAAGVEEMMISAMRDLLAEYEIGWGPFHEDNARSIVREVMGK